MVTVTNAEIADKFDELADLLDIEDANPFRVRAYRNAARMIRRHPRRFVDLVSEQTDLAELPDIGESLAQKIVTIVETGKLPALEEARRRTPAVLSTLMKMRGIGPKRVRRLHDELKIRSMADLERAAKQGRIRDLAGFGGKTEALILAQLAGVSATEQRRGRLEAREIAEPLKQYLERIDGVKRVAVAGSYRRCRETVGDLDILVTASRGADVIGRFIAYDNVAEVVSHGSTRSTVTLHSGMQVDIRVVPDVSYGAALLYFTGSKDHNIALRKIGQRKRLKVNEYGVFRGDERIAGRTESEVYAALGLPFIAPELRENRGEVEAAAKGALPELLTRSDIRGDLHCHTSASDGHHSIRDMAEAAKAMGYEYIAITDHSQHVRVAHGLDAERLAAQIDEIDKINDELDGLVVLKSCEVDILDDGALDVRGDLLRRLDLTVCAVHYAFNLSRSRQTRRILKAMDNEYFNILAHPTGRLINERPPYEVDLERIMAAASRRGCFLELNAYPDRLDLTDEACRMAKERGVTVAIGTDAHSADTLDFMGFGVDQARRGWLGPGDVLNTRSLKELRSLLAR